MASLTLSVSEELKSEFKKYSWVNWSEIAREEAMKKLIFENFLKTKKLSDEDWEFCEKIDWHPVDELPYKESFIKEIKARKWQKAKKISVNEIFK